MERRNIWDCVTMIEREGLSLNFQKKRKRGPRGVQNQPHDGKNAFGGVCSERQDQRQNIIHTVLHKMSF